MVFHSDELPKCFGESADSKYAHLEELGELGLAENKNLFLKAPGGRTDFTTAQIGKDLGTFPNSNVDLCWLGKLFQPHYNCENNNPNRWDKGALCPCFAAMCAGVVVGAILHAPAAKK